MVKFTAKLQKHLSVEKHVCTFHAPNEKDDMMSRQKGSMMHHLANAHSVTGPASSYTKRLFLTLAGRPLDRMY